MGVKNLDLIGAILLVALNVGWTQLSHRPSVLGIILALPLTLILPGYTLTQSLFGRRLAAPSNKLVLQPSLKIGQPVGAVDYIILSLGLSLAIDVLVGFALNVFPIGLQALSWTLSLGLVTTLFSLLAAFRRRKDSVVLAKAKKPHITIYDSLLFALAVIVASAAIWFSVLRPPTTQDGFTQFSMLQSDPATNSCAVHIYVQNQGSITMEYRVVVIKNGVTLQTWSSVILAPQANWNQLVSLASRKATTMHIEGQLYQSDKPATDFQKVDVTLHLLRKSQDGRILQCETA